jgi:hypothetical protein
MLQTPDPLPAVPARRIPDRAGARSPAALAAAVATRWLAGLAVLALAPLGAPSSAARGPWQPPGAPQGPARPSGATQEAAPSPQAPLPPETPQKSQGSEDPAQDAAPETSEASAEPAPAIELDAAALAAELEALAARFPDRTRLSTYGSSVGGLPLWCLEARGPEADPEAPALLLVAALDGWRCFETRAALSLAEALLVGEWPGVETAQREKARGARLLLVPRADPDGAAERLAGATAPPRPAPLDQRPLDSDRDGRVRDGQLADLDGDGARRWMRFEHKRGTLLRDGDEPRLLRAPRAEQGERGTWRLEPEGLDGDGDGRIAEDLESPERPALQFPPGWLEHSAPGGPWPGHLPEARALMDLVLAHPELWGALVLDAYDSLVAPAEAAGGGRLPAPGFLAADLPWAKALGEAYREHTGIAERPRGEPAGRFERWLYEHRGLWTVSARLFDLPVGPAAAEATPAEAGQGGQEGAAASPRSQRKPASGDGNFERDAGRLRWIDARPEEAWRFAPWTCFEHPELGPVELGGWHPLASYDPPAGERRPLTEGLTRFLAELLASRPTVDFGRIEAEALGAGLYRLEVELLDLGRAQSPSAAAERARTAAPVTLRFGLPAESTRLAGDLEQRGEAFPGPGRSRLHTLLLTGRPGQSVTLDLLTPNAGRARREVSLP